MEVSHLAVCFEVLFPFTVHAPDAKILFLISDTGL